MKLLDLFSGAGGAAMGYYRAGFTDITGVDLAPQPRYPFRFVQADALGFLRGLISGGNANRFDLIHASPPCQGYSRMRFLPWLRDNDYPLLIDETRELLEESGVPYVIENVSDAPLDGGLLCGASLGLSLSRHRRFECRPFILFPPCPGHNVIEPGRASLSTRYSRSGGVTGVMNGVSAEEATEIDWMIRRELAQAIPPAYTEYIGNQMRALL